MTEEPIFYQEYSLCTPDCEHGNHFGEWIHCDRCNSLVHVQVFEVYHPTYGDMRIGAECFKDVMGFKFGKSHEKAIVTKRVLDQYAEKLQEVLPGETFVPRGNFAALGLPRDGTAVKRLYCYLVFEDDTGYLRYLYSHNMDNIVRSPKVPYGWSMSIIRAGLDLNLWEEVELSNFPNGVGTNYKYVMGL